MGCWNMSKTITPCRYNKGPHRGGGATGKAREPQRGVPEGSPRGESQRGFPGPRGESQRGVPEGSPRGESQRGVPEGSPRGESQRGVPEGSPRGESQRGVPEGSPRGESQRGVPEGSPRGKRVLSVLSDTSILEISPLSRH